MSLKFSVIKQSSTFYRILNTHTHILNWHLVKLLPQEDVSSFYHGFLNSQHPTQYSQWYILLSLRKKKICNRNFLLQLGNISQLFLAPRNDLAFQKFPYIWVLILVAVAFKFQCFRAPSLPREAGQGFMSPSCGCGVCVAPSCPELLRYLLCHSLLSPLPHHQVWEGRTHIHLGYGLFPEFSLVPGI